MKILHAAETIKGGVATIVDELIDDQSKTFGSVDLLIPDEHIDYITPGAGKNIFSFKRSGRSILGFINFSLSFINLIRKNKYDIVHLHSTFAGVLGRMIIFLMRTDVKVIYCPHAFSFLMNTGAFKKRFYSTIERTLQTQADWIICVSKYERDIALSLGLKEDNLVVIHNGVKKDPDWKYNNDRFDSVRSINISFVGRLDYQKGFDVLNRVIKRFINEDTRDLINFHIVGESVNDSSIDLELKSQGNINVIQYGWLSQSEIKDIYKISHLVIMPSRWEGFGLVATESFQYGTPVIASNNTSLSELIDDKVNGFLFSTGSDDEVYDIIKNITFGELKAMSTNCYSIYLEKYTSENMLEKTKQLYK